MEPRMQSRILEISVISDRYLSRINSKYNFEFILKIKIEEISCLGPFIGELRLNCEFNRQILPFIPQ